MVLHEFNGQRHLDYFDRQESLEDSIRMAEDLRILVWGLLLHAVKKMT